MVSRCCVQGCRSECYRGCGISFFRFPKDAKMREKWLSVIPTRSRKISNTSMVCSKHFLREDYVPHIYRSVLKQNAVPSLLLFHDSNNQPAIGYVQLLPGEENSDYEEEPTMSMPTIEYKDVAVQTQKTADCDELRRKIKILTAKLRRRDAGIKKLKARLSGIKKNRNLNEVEIVKETHSLGMHNYCKDMSPLGSPNSDEWTDESIYL